MRRHHFQSWIERWLHGEVADFEPQGAKPWPLVRVEGEAEPRAWPFIDTAAAPGFTMEDMVSPRSSWAYAVARNGQSSPAALTKGLGRLQIC